MNSDFVSHNNFDKFGFIETNISFLAIILIPTFFSKYFSRNYSSFIRFEIKKCILRIALCDPEKLQDGFIPSIPNDCHESITNVKLGGEDGYKWAAWECPNVKFLFLYFHCITIDFSTFLLF